MVKNGSDYKSAVEEWREASMKNISDNYNKLNEMIASRANAQAISVESSKQEALELIKRLDALKEHNDKLQSQNEMCENLIEQARQICKTIQ